jgi:hypothetical protein
MNIDDERNEASDEPAPSRSKLGLGRVVVVLALAWLAITAFAWLMDIVHRGMVVLIIAAVLFVIVKLSMVSRKSKK